MTQYGYAYAKVLILASRVLDSQFPSVSIELSGAQLEMLRNMTQYLNERTTFVDTYHTNYYEIPSDEDWDTILAIVADLEDKLMGNGNVALGYNDRVYEEVTDMDADAGTNTLQMDVVPSGYAYFVQAIGTSNGNKAVTQTKSVATATSQLGLDRVVTGTPNIWHTILPNNIVLRQGDSIEGKFFGCDAGDNLYLSVWGYRMVVPE